MRGRLAAAAGLIVAVAAAVPAAAQDGGRVKTAKGKSQPVYTESVVDEYRVETAFGQIYGWVRRPVVPAGVRVPVILTYTPYSSISAPVAGQDLGDDVDDYYVPRGYARAWFHLVGTGRSGGCTDHGGLRERRTAHDVVEFLGRRDWSNGKVGMVGASYDGTTQWAAAIEQPRHLATIVPQVAITSWWDYAFGQGVRFYSGTLTPVGFDFGFAQAGIPDPADPQATIDKFMPCERLRHNERAFLPDPVFDGYWDERHYRALAKKVKVPVMIEGSWTDYNVHPINSTAIWPLLSRSLPKRLLMGQQGHGTFDGADAADVRHAWFDQHLLGLDTGVLELPDVDSISNAKRRQNSTWPPAGTTSNRLPLATGPKADHVALADGTLPRWRDLDPLLAEDDIYTGGGRDAATLLVSEPVAGPVRIAGTAVLDLRLRTSAVSTHVTPTLFDEAPTGRRTTITRGLLNSRNRRSNRRSEPLGTGDSWRAQVRFQPVDWDLAKGHRLGVAIMSMNRFEAMYPDDTAAENEIDLARSELRVPVASGDLGIKPLKPPPPVAVIPPPVVAPAPARPVSTCRRGRTVTLRARARGTTRVTVDGRRVKTTRARRVRVKLPARSRRKVHVVRLVTRTKGGRRLTVTRRIRACR